MREKTTIDTIRTLNATRREVLTKLYKGGTLASEKDKIWNYFSELNSQTRLIQYLRWCLQCEK